MKNKELNLEGRQLNAGTGYSAEDGSFEPSRMEAYEVAAHFGTDMENGLTKQKVRRKRMEVGVNAFQPEHDASMANGIKRQLCGVYMPLMVVSLLLCAAFTSGAEVYTPLAALLVAIMFINAALESHAASTLNKTTRANAMRTTVLRGGKLISVSSVALVPGDMIQLENGSVVPADARLCEANRLTVLETPITGIKESTEKDAEYIARGEENGSYNMVYAGTIVTSGRATAIVCRTGKSCRLYKSQGDMGKLPSVFTSIIRKFSMFSIVLSALCFLLVVVGLIIGRPLVDAYMMALSCAVCCMPQSAYALGFGGFAAGVRRMYKKGAVLRRFAVVDTLCVTDSLMCDKDVAFPMSELRPKRVFINKDYYTVSPESKANIKKVLTYALLCSDLRRSATAEKLGDGFFGMPADVSLARECDRIGIDIDSFKEEYFRIEADYGKNGEIKRALYLHNDANLLIMRGTPEEILPLCAGYDAGNLNNRFDEYSRRRMEQAAKAMGDASQHVIAIASAVCDCDSLKNTVTAQRRLVLNGFIGLYTSLELDSAGAVYKCAAGGIETVLLSGDAYVTAVNMAKNAGIIKDEKQVIAAEQLKYADRGLYIADSEKYKLYLHFDEEQWLDAMRIRRDKGHTVAVTAESTDRLAMMREADVSFVPAATSAETVKYAADVLLYKNGLKTVESVLSTSKVIYRRIAGAARQLCIGGTALFVCFAIALFAGGAYPMRIQEALIGGSLLNLLLAFACAYAPDHRKLLQDRVDYKGSLYSGLFSVIYGALAGACLYGTSVLLARLGVSEQETAFCMLLSFAVCLFGGMLFGAEQQHFYRSSAFKNALVPIMGLVCAACIALFGAVPRLSVLLGYALPQYRAVLVSFLVPVALFALSQTALIIKELIAKPNKSKLRKETEI